MAEAENICIRLLDEKSDYELWCLCLKEGISAKGLKKEFKATNPTWLSTVQEVRKSSQCVTYEQDSDSDVEDELEQGSNIIFSVLVDNSLRVIRIGIWYPEDMIQKLDER